MSTPIATRLAKWLLWFTVAVFVLYLVIYVVYAGEFPDGVLAAYRRSAS